MRLQTRSVRTQLNERPPLGSMRDEIRPVIFLSMDN
jgi:hypothetical protein